METFELRAESDNSYKYLRVEQSVGLSQLFQDIESGATPRKDIKQLAGQIVCREIREVLERPVAEDRLYTCSASTLRQSKRQPCCTQTRDPAKGPKAKVEAKARVPAKVTEATRPRASTGEPPGRLVLV